MRQSHATKAIFILFAIIGIFPAVKLADSLISEDVYRKDVIQEYLLAKSVMYGTNPYLPLPELARSFIIEIPIATFPHSTPHPPPVAVAVLPLALFNFRPSATIWMIFELVCLFTILRSLESYADGETSTPRTLLMVLASLLWPPVFLELALGQLMIPLCALLVPMWLALRVGKQLKGGILLGLLLAFKMLAWPLFIYFALKRQWRVVLSAIGVFALANLIALAVIGPEAIIHYYTQVAPNITEYYRSDAFNISTNSVGYKVFLGTGGKVLDSLIAAPIVNAPKAAFPFSLLFTTALVVGGIYLAWRPNLDIAFSVLTCVSVIVNPVAWNHYMVMLVVPFVVAWRCLTSLGFPRSHVRIALTLAALLFFTSSPISILRVIYGVPIGPFTVPSFVALFGLAPTATVILSMYYLRSLSRETPNDYNS